MQSCYQQPRESHEASEDLHKTPKEAHEDLWLLLVGDRYQGRRILSLVGEVGQDLGRRLNIGFQHLPNHMTPKGP